MLIFLQTELVDDADSPVFTVFEYFFTLAFTLELCLNMVAYFFIPFFQASDELDASGPRSACAGSKFFDLFCDDSDGTCRTVQRLVITGKE